ncbi:MAG: T9SS type A sorting domain-containing protein, partial [Ferruginibacter sp.]
GTYQLIASTNSGCPDTALVNLSFSAKPNLGTDKAITKCTDSIVNLTTLFTTTGLTTAWTIGGVPVATPASVIAAGVYQLIGSSNPGCSDTALVTITSNQQLCTVITPPLSEQIIINYCKPPSKYPCNPPINDILPVYIVRNSIATVTVIIYNYLGQIVYHMNFQHQPSVRTYNIPMKNIAGGIYIVTVSINNEKQDVKKIFRVNYY